jgi:hypothetical protein
MYDFNPPFLLQPFFGATGLSNWQTSLNKGCVTLWPCHLDFKIPLRQKKIMEIQIFHRAKI